MGADVPAIAQSAPSGRTNLRAGGPVAALSSCRLAEDQFKELDQPALEMHVPDQPSAEMIAAWLSARQHEAVRAPHDPALHHGARKLGVKLDAPCIPAIAKRLVGIGVGSCEQRCAGGQ